MGEDLGEDEGTVVERACSAARRVVSMAGEGGASSAGNGGGAGESNVAFTVGGESFSGVDPCENYVDPPPMYYDEGCIGLDDENRLGECVLDNECCVVLEFLSCGV